MSVIISEFILYIGFILLAVGFVPVLGQAIGWVMNLLLNIMNAVVLALEKLPFSVIDGIWLSGLQAWLLAWFLLMVSWFLIYRNRVFLVGASLIILISSGFQWAKMLVWQKQQLWVVYYLKNSSGLAFVKGRQVTLLSDSLTNSSKADFRYNIQPHWWQLGIQNASYVSLQKPDALSPAYSTPAGNSVMIWRGLRVLILAQPEKFILTSNSPIPVDYVLIRNNVKLDLLNLKQVFQFKCLIFDASDKNWYCRKMQEVCQQQQIPFYDVSKEGAFVAQWE